jgi:GT2 family glycosyltransferase
MHKIAVVILNWNGRKLLEEFLPSVTYFSPNAKIYVADNASTDTSINFIKDNYPDISIIQNKTNGGFAKGYNEALQQVREPYYCLLNSDVAVTENWLDEIEHIFNSRSNIAIIQPKVLDYKRPKYFEYAGAAGGFVDQLGYPYCRGRIFETLEEDTGQYDDEIEIFWATGACLFIRKEVFHLVGGFDEDFFAHQEEIDLCWRVKNLGFSIIYTPKSVVFHLGGATLDNMNPKKTFLNFRNSLFSLVKNAPKFKGATLVFFRLILDGIAGIRFIFQGKFDHCWAIIKAHFNFYKNLPKFIKKRKNTKNKIKYYNSTSIVWAYFVQNRKNFNILQKD